MNWEQQYRLRSFFQNSIWILPVMATWPPSIDPGASTGSRADRLAIQPRSQLGPVDVGHTGRGHVYVHRVSFFHAVACAATGQCPTQPSYHRAGFPRPGVPAFLDAVCFYFQFHVGRPPADHAFRADDHDPYAAYLCLLSLVVFLFLVGHVGKTLRPSGVLRAVARIGHEIIQSVYPRRLSGPGNPPEPRKRTQRQSNPHSSEHEGWRAPGI